MARARKIDPAVWESHKAEIESKYMDQTVDELKMFMEQHHGFTASKPQYIRKLRQWGFEKYSSNQEWKFISQQLRKRKLDGKESDVYVNGRLLPSKKVKKEMSRYSLPTYDMIRQTGLSPEPPDGISIRTPAADVAPPLEYLHIPWLQFCRRIESEFKLLCTPAAEAFPSLNHPTSSYNSPTLLPAGYLDSAQLAAGKIWDPAISLTFLKGFANAEARKLVADCLGVSVDPGGADFLLRISRHIEDATISSHCLQNLGDVRELGMPSGLDVMFRFMSFLIYLSSNNLLSDARTDKFLLWIVESGFSLLLERVIKLHLPTTEIFASNLLCSAIRLDYVDILHILIRNGVEVNNADGQALTEAIKKRSCLFVQILLDSGADPNLYEDFYGKTHLELAINMDLRPEGISRLLNAGADLSILTADALYLILKRAVSTYDFELLRIFVGACSKQAGHASCMEGNILARMCGNELVHAFLISLAEVADLDWQVVERRDTIHIPDLFIQLIEKAAVHDDVEVAQILLEIRTDFGGISSKSYYDHDEYCSRTWGWCGDAVCDAAKNGNTILVRILLRAGAYIDGGSKYSALQIAAKESDKKMVRILLNNGANVNLPPKDKWGCTALEAAAAIGDNDLVQILIDAGADIRSDGAALQAAAVGGGCSMVRILVNAGASINARTASRYGNTCLQAAAESGDLEVVRFLIGEGADVNAPASEDGGTALQAASGNTTAEIVQILLDNGASPNESTGPDWALSIAAAQGDDDIVRILIRAGARVNDPGKRRGTALQAAASGGYLSTVRLLLDAGADINSSPSGLKEWTALEAAASSNNFEMVRLFLEKGAKQNTVVDASLCSAVSLENVPMVKILLEAGMDVNRSRLSSNTPLHYAVEMRNMELVKLLVNAGADVNAAPGSANENTALQLAVKNSDLELVKLLMQHGADVNGPASEWFGGTALQRAVEAGNIQIAMILLEAGADVNAPAAKVWGETALKAAVEYGRLDILHLLLDNDGDPETLEIRRKEAEDLAGSIGQWTIAWVLGDYKRT